MDVVLTIDDRQALAVWTLPYIVPFRRLSPDRLLRKLVDSNSRFPVSFTLNNSGLHSNLPSEQWRELHNLISRLDNDLTELSLPSMEDWEQWFDKSIKLFWKFESSYVWLDEFKQWYERFIKTRLIIDDDENTELCFNVKLLESHADYFQDVELSKLETKIEAKKEYTDAFNRTYPEIVKNGGPINWNYWLDLENVTPSQAARLANHIDPKTWSGDKLNNHVDFDNSLHEKISRLEQWLENRATTWSLAALVAALGEDNAPIGMVEVVKSNDTFFIQLLTKMVEGLPKYFVTDSIAELWAAIPNPLNLRNKLYTINLISVKI